MSLSCRIIKGAEVREIPLRVLPLRRHAVSAQPAETMSGSAEDADAGTSLRVLEQARAEAEETVNRARGTAEDIMRKAQLESEQIKQQAYQDAFDRGCREGGEKGYREGLAKAEEEAAVIRAQATEVLEQAEKIRRRTLEALEGEVIDLAREIAEKLLSAQLALEPGTVLNVAAASLRLVAERLNVVLHVNPGELELVESKKGKMLGLLSAGAELQVIADASIQPGGCRVETEQGRVDATMEARREALLNALYGRE